MAKRGNGRKAVADVQEPDATETSEEVVARVEKSDKDTAKREEFMAKARERFQRARDYWGTLYEKSKEDLRFYSGDQWPDEIKMQRELPGAQARPCLTINRLPQFHNQIVNDYRQSTLGMKAAPQGAEDVEVGKIYQGLFRQIEKQSHAQVAYIKALSDAAIHGIGYVRVITDYADQTSFDQDIFIKRFTNPFVNYPDPDATEFFLEDAQFWFVIDKMRNEDYDDQYGEDYDRDDFPADETRSAWRDGDYVTIAEYFYFESKKRWLLELNDGSRKFQDEIEPEVLDELKLAGAIRRKRKVDAKVLKWCKIDGANILEETEWAMPRIPITPVWGNELWIEDERMAKGVVRDAKDSQRMYNYWQSAKTEMIALAPKAPYIAAEGQLEGSHADDWNSASVTAKSVLYYKPVSVDGHLVPPPQRQTYEAPVQAIIQASMQSSDDMKATIGIYDASLGARGNEVSGKAITARQREGDTATYNFVDNLALTVGYVGIVVSELIPKIYDTERQLRIIGDDGSLKNVKVNGQNDKDITLIRYDLVLDTGPSFATQRQQTAETIIELAHNNPKVMDLAGDIAIANMDFAGAQEIAKRLKRALPPQIVADEEDPEAKLGAAQTQLAQMQELIQALQGELTEKDKELLEANLFVKNKKGELDVRRRELALKAMEVRAKLREAADTKRIGEDTGALAAEAASGVGELRTMIEGVMDMLLEIVPHEQVEGALETPPAAPQEPAPAALEGEPPAPVEGAPEPA